MTMTAEGYIERVMSQLPQAAALRKQIADELRGLFAERMERGQTEDQIASQLGDPVTLAESYLASVPLVPASFLERLVAKIVDFLIVSAAIVPIFCLLWLVLTRVAGPWWGPALLGFAAAAAIMSLPAYTLLFEYLLGHTLGKRLFSLRVVRESGARISLGQSFVRQLPFVGQIFMIDALFALFTEKHQRAFELASKTRVVKAAD